SDHVAQQTLRRGGKTHVLSIDFMTAEQLYHGNRSASTDVASPADEFDRAWAVTLLERAIDRLRLEYDAKQQTRRFELLVPSLRSVELDYDAIADTLEVTPTAVRKAASRFRQRYGQLLREEVSATLSSEGDTDEEISWMIGLFAK
ncbi:MAG: hypothetical protein AB8B91_07025, partial [Rubripirellula sp.]